MELSSLLGTLAPSKRRFLATIGLGLVALGLVFLIGWALGTFTSWGWWTLVLLLPLLAYGFLGPVRRITPVVILVGLSAWFGVEYADGTSCDGESACEDYGFLFAVVSGIVPATVATAIGAFVGNWVRLTRVPADSR